MPLQSRAEPLVFTGQTLKIGLKGMLRTLALTFSVMTLADYMLETIEWVAHMASDFIDCPVSTNTSYLFSWAQFRS